MAFMVFPNLIDRRVAPPEPYEPRLSKAGDSSKKLYAKDIKGILVVFVKCFFLPTSPDGFSILPDGKKHVVARKKLRDIFQVSTNFKVIATKKWIAPGNHWSIFQKCREGGMRSHHFGNILQAILNISAIPSTARHAPGEDFSILRNCGPSKRSAIDVLHFHIFQLL